MFLTFKVDHGVLVDQSLIDRQSITNRTSLKLSNNRSFEERRSDHRLDQKRPTLTTAAMDEVKFSLTKIDHVIDDHNRT